MRNLNGFIEVTSLNGGKKALIRVDSIVSVYDNADEYERYADGLHLVKPAHRQIIYSGISLDVVEPYDEIIEMMYQAEL